MAELLPCGFLQSMVVQSISQRGLPKRSRPEFPFEREGREGVRLPLLAGRWQHLPRLTRRPRPAHRVVCRGSGVVCRRLSQGRTEPERERAWPIEGWWFRDQSVVCSVPATPERLIASRPRGIAGSGRGERVNPRCHAETPVPYRGRRPRPSAAAPLEWNGVGECSRGGAGRHVTPGGRALSFSYVTIRVRFGPRAEQRVQCEQGQVPSVVCLEDRTG